MHSTCFLNTPSIKGSSQKLPGRRGKITSKWIRSPNGFELLSETSLITPTLKPYAQPHHFPSSGLSKNLPPMQISQEFPPAKMRKQNQKEKETQDGRRKHLGAGEGGEGPGASKKLRAYPPAHRPRGQPTSCENR